ncbi:MAG TPA: extracellular solute-binding protein [Gaiellaceae bacterium]|nr:extracellular solute-binding protein [Gaiellaceae bacterium]
MAYALLAVPLAVLAAGCGGGGGGGSSSGSSDIKGNVSITGVWTGDEQKSFQAVLDAFMKKYPNVKVKYNSSGDNTPTVLSTAVQGGNPPDLASVSQPGLMKDFQKKGALKPLDFAKSDINDNYPSDFVKLTTIGGKIYGLIFKGANKSTIWYNVKSLKDAGVEAPKTWDDLIKDASTIKASGTTPFSVGGADGWTLTDLFENIYLRQAGAAKYDQLSNHTIKWTDPSVKKALQTMGQYLKGDLVAGGTSGALQTDFPTSVSNVFSDSPKAAMVAEGDFVPGVVASSNPLKPIDGYNVFAFPSVDGSGDAVVGGGDTIMMFNDTPASEALIKYLSTAEASEIWAKRGGFSSPNKNLDTGVYPDEITKTTASALATAKTFRFDMSDLQPAAFGGTVGQGEFKIFQDFLKNPSDVDGTAQALETSAAKAYASK